MTSTSNRIGSIPASGLAGISRRQFVVGSSALASGGLALGLTLAATPPAGAQTAAMAQGAEVTVWVLIQPDDSVVVRLARSEMGQGTRTGLAQLVAEELACDWRKVSTEYVTPGRNLASKRAWGDMGTGGSRGIRGSHDYVRQGGAAARAMLLQAAASEWGVPVAELAVSDGTIRHAASNRSTGYGKVALAASKLPVPDFKTIKLKDARNWKVAGKPLPRLDTLGKLDGSQVFGADVRLPGMLSAAIRDCPVFGGKLISFDDSKVKAMRGVKAVVKVGATGVAVVADNWWRAKTALEQLPVVWDEGANANVSSSTIAAHLKEGLDAPGDYAGRKEGDALKAIAGAARKVEALYSTPFLAHACMEPMNATVLYTSERAEVWVPTQNGEGSHAALAAATGLPLDKCEVYKLDLGGGFGRRGGNQDYVRQAALIAMQFPGTPIKLLWTREEDIAHDFYRPISQCQMSAGLDASGQLVGLQLRSSGQSINAWVNPQGIRDGKDERQLQGFWKEPGDAQMGYTIPNLLTEYAIRNTHVPVGTWRGVNTNQNAVYLECFIEEVARESAKSTGKDALEFRRALMQNHPKHLAVLNAAAEKAGWGKPLPTGVFRGIAQFMGYGSYSAAVAEVSVGPNNALKVHRMVLALNCGHAVNPQQIAAQIEGGVAYGLSATFYGENTIDKGRVKETNFDTYPILRLPQMPVVETIIVPTYDFWGGVGEPTICVVAPAVLNALQAATGKPARSLPLRNLGYTFA